MRLGSESRQGQPFSSAVTSSRVPCAARSQRSRPPVLIHALPPLISSLSTDETQRTDRLSVARPIRSGPGVPAEPPCLLKTNRVGTGSLACLANARPQIEREGRRPHRFLRGLLAGANRPELAIDVDKSGRRRWRVMTIASELVSRNTRRNFFFSPLRPIAGRVPARPVLLRALAERTPEVSSRNWNCTPH